MRADVFLFRVGMAKSRSHAQALISGGVLIGGKKVEKPSTDVPDDTAKESVTILSPSGYVGRGGIKLRHALKMFGIDAGGLIAVDLGASTGGFTDCLLQNGAKKVYAVDVGHGQLAPSLSADGRVVNMEGTNARTLTKGSFPDGIDLVTSDLSFISQTLVLPAVSDILSGGGMFVSLIKPQFEAGKGNVGKGGIVRDRKVQCEVIENVFAAARAHGLEPRMLAPSAIEGGDGNREYIALFVKDAERMEITGKQISDIVNSKDCEVVIK